MSEKEPKDANYQKTYDYVHEYAGYWDHHTPGDKCRIRVYERDGDIPIVIATDLPTNPGMGSMSGLTEFIAAEIIQRHFPDRFGMERAVTWIEQYLRTEKEKRIHRMLEYAFVEFNSYDRSEFQRRFEPRARIGTPHWRFVPDEEVEALLGHKPT